MSLEQILGISRSKLINLRHHAKLLFVLSQQPVVFVLLFSFQEVMHSHVCQRSKVKKENTVCIKQASKEDRK